MRIVITADPEVPVPPTLYGGIERIIHFLAEGLTERGHEVVLFAHEDSRVTCDLRPYPGKSSRSRLDTLRNSLAIASCVRAGAYDALHSFGRLGYLTPLAWHPVRKLMSYQRPITEASITRATKLFGASLEFTACSRHMVDPRLPGIWHIVYNGVPLEKFAFRDRVSDGAPLVFLGRLEEIKGPHFAIEAARASGRPLLLAGNIEPAHQGFFDAKIRPFLDGRTIQYLGPVDDRRKSDLLGRGAALLMPIVWDEPFGIVMAEALACGTPVIAFRRGSVPEVVRHGVTGFVASDVAGLVEGIRRLNTIDRKACRIDAEARFSHRAIVDAYEALYRQQPTSRAPSSCVA